MMFILTRILRYEKIEVVFGPTVYGGTGSMSIENNSGNGKNNQDLQQLQQRNWVKEQEVSALKVQNRHLLSKLEEAEVRAKPNQLYTQQISSEIQNYLKPLATEIQRQNQVTQIQIEKSLSQAFEMIQSTLRGVYQQSLRAQETVETLSAHTRDLELKMSEQRKADQFYFQEKVFSSMTAFCERIERQIETRLKALSSIDILSAKQSEVLDDVESLKISVQGMFKNSESNRADLSRFDKQVSENTQKLGEIEIYGRNSEELARDTLQQIENHRNEFKTIRNEMKYTLDQFHKLYERFNSQPNEIQIKQQLQDLEVIDSIENITEIESVLGSQETETGKEDVGMILELLKAQKDDLKKIVKEKEGFLRKLKFRSDKDKAAAEVQEVSMDENGNASNATGASQGGNPEANA